jgi:hypothetical protein
MVVGALFILTLIAALRGWATRREGLLWVVVWVAAGVAIIRPNVTTVVARWLGIQRGADLILYCSVVVMMIGFLMIYVRLRHLRRELTLLVRQIAIRDAMMTPPADSTDDENGSRRGNTA